MLAIAAYPGSLSPRLVEVAAPAPPGPGLVLCRTLQLGICGTDREILHSLRPWLPANEDFLVLGHECLAQVMETGPGVDLFRAGDLVVPTVRRAAAGAGHRIDMLSLGQFTERGILGQHGFSAPLWVEEPRYLYGVPESLQPLAVFTEPLAVAEKGIHEALAVQRARLGDDTWTTVPPRVLVTGPGPIGFAGIVACLCRGWPATLYGRDPADGFRANLARDLGAAWLPHDQARFDSRDAEAEGFDLVLECTGSDEVMVGAARALAPRGAMVWLGSSRRPQPLALNVAHMMRDGLLRNHVHIGSVNAAPRDFEAALRHLDQLRATHAAPLARLFTARVPPGDSLWHYEHREPDGIKVVLEYG